MTPTVNVSSELAALSLIVTSPPGPEFDLMVPDNLERYRRDEASGRLIDSPDYLLFDDLVLLSQMQVEHRQLVDVVSAVTGANNHLTWRSLLVETLSDAEARHQAIDRTLALEARLYHASSARRDAVRVALEELDAPRLTQAFTTGRHPYDNRPLFCWPAPNALFARDLAAVVGDAVVMTYAAEPARGREMLLSRLILQHHRLFNGVDKLDVGVAGRGRLGHCIEGGDIQVLSPQVVLVGIGIRTTLAAVERLAPMLFERGVKVVLGFELPRRRAAMHIDTLFTHIDQEHCLIYPPLVEHPERLGARVHRFTPDGVEDAGPALLPALEAAGIPLRPVYCGGDDPIAQAREQWSDGANAFALAPGVIVTYGRNPHTLRELNRVGYEVVSAERFVENALYYISHDRRVAVALRGHELVRGRGGPRCLTQPLARAPS